MSNRQQKYDRSELLRSAMLYLIAWIGLLLLEVSVFKEAGMLQSLSKIKEGDFVPVLLLAASIILLALILRSFLLYFQGDNHHDEQDS